MTPEHVEALVRLLVVSGDLTPAGARVIRAALAEDEARDVEGGGIGDE